MTDIFYEKLKARREYWLQRLNEPQAVMLVISYNRILELADQQRKKEH